MKIDIPVFNPDGSVQFTQTCSPEEAQLLLQFALNFLVSNGLMVIKKTSTSEKTISEALVQLND